MTNRPTPGVFGSDMICPECLEGVRDLPPTDWGPSWTRPDYSHQDGTELCPDWSNYSGSNKGGLKPRRPVVLVPLKEFTSA
ncbi:hypothetical protein AB0I72_28245 [Nocardiopsis sp. NPDC049922]|uniref:hypothetical protein n=1 Tax=Nocardiopsis sp. NPDC049922 TaxID=3155157 RepID=UPI0033CE604F